MNCQMLRLLMMAGVIFAILFPASVAQASHGRYAHVSWELVDGAGKGEQRVRFTMTKAYRRTFFGNLNIGDTFSSGNWVFGDGSSTGILLKVIAIDPVDDWLVAVAGRMVNQQFVEGLINDYNASGGPYTATFSLCCRIGGLQNSANAQFGFRTTVNLNHQTGSAISALTPIVNVPVNTEHSFFVPATSPGGNPMTWRFATSTEAGGGSNNPVPSADGHSAAINETTGVFSWNTAGTSVGQLWTSQVVIEERDPNTDEVLTNVPVDFILRIVSAEGTPPECLVNPAGPLTIVPGQDVEILASGTDQDSGDMIMLNSPNLPANASSNPQLPVTGEQFVESLITWTPTTDQVGNNVIPFIVTDSGGLQAACNVLIHVANRELWRPLQAGISGTVFALQAYTPVGGALSGQESDDIYVGGSITSAGGSPVVGIARWDGENWSSVGGGVGGTFPLVNDMIVWNGELYVTGSFTTAGGVTVNNIAKWNGENWTNLGSGLSGTGWSLAVYNDELYVGGAFAQAGGVTVNRIARWDGSSWSSVGGGVSGGLTRVYAMQVYEDQLYVGGNFSSAGGVPASRIARWNREVWSAVGDGVNATVRAMAVYEDVIPSTGITVESLYVGGAFTMAGGMSVNRIARWDNFQWMTVGSGVEGLGDDTVVLALDVHDDGQGESLYVGGGFTTAGGVDASNLARWDGFSWHPYGVGMNAHVSALGVGDDGEGEVIFAGGPFNAIGGIDADGIVRWLGIYQDAIVPSNPTHDTSSPINDNTQEFDNTNASTDGPEEPGACEFAGDAQIHADLWYDYTTPCDGTLTVSLCESSFATKLAVYNFFDDINDRVLLGCDTYSCGGYQAELTLDVLEGQTVRLRVGGRHAGETGSGMLNLVCTPYPLGDINRDGAVDMTDLILLLGNWGSCADPGNCPADLTGSYQVGLQDLVLLIENWKPTTSR